MYSDCGTANYFESVCVCVCVGGGGWLVTQSGAENVHLFLSNSL